VSSPDYIDLGETPDLDRLTAMTEAARAHCILRKFDLVGGYLVGHERRLHRVECRCRSWHGPVLKWLLGLVVTGGSGATGYLLFLAARKIFGS